METLPKRYSEIRIPVAYENIQSLATDLYDGVQRPRLIWFRRDGPMGLARRRTMYDPHYIQELLEKEADYGELVVQMSKNPLGGLHLDEFDFRKQSGSWLLRCFRINHKNFDFYTFEGIESGLDPLSTPVFYCVYAGDFTFQSQPQSSSLTFDTF